MSVVDIQKAIESLTPVQLAELNRWLEPRIMTVNFPQSVQKLLRGFTLSASSQNKILEARVVG